MNEDRTFDDEEAKEKTKELWSKAHLYADKLTAYGFTGVGIVFRYGEPGTGSARAIVSGVRKMCDQTQRGRSSCVETMPHNEAMWCLKCRSGILDHAVTLEVLYRLIGRRGPEAKFIGGSWDGGRIRNLDDLQKLAKPMSIKYTTQTKPNSGSASRSKQGSASRKESPMVAKKTPAKKAAPAKAAAKKAPAKKAVAKKAPAKKAPAKKASPAVETTEAREAREARNAEHTKAILKMRGNGSPWSEVASSLSISEGHAQLLLMRHEAGETETATPARVKAARDKDAMSWGQIMARFGITKAGAHKFYREAGGDPSRSDIGRGGRGIIRDAKKVAAKKAAPKKAAPQGKPIFDDETDKDAIVAKIDGKVLTWNKPTGNGTDSAKIMGGTVKVGRDKKQNRVVQFSEALKDDNGVLHAGGSRTVFVTSIIKATVK